MEPTPKKTKTSDLWNVFTPINSVTAICNMCKHQFSYKSTTTNLRKHLRSRHPTVVVQSRTLKIVDSSHPTNRGDGSVSDDGSVNGFPWPDTDAIPNPNNFEEDPIGVMDVTVKDESSNEQLLENVNDWPSDLVHQGDVPLIKQVKIDEIRERRDSKMDEVQTVENTTPKTKTPNQLFVEYIGAKLEKYNDYVQSVVQHNIAEILFHADMGHYKLSNDKN